MNWPPKRVSKADISSVSPSSERIDGLTLKMSAFESLSGGKFTLPNQLIKPNYTDKLFDKICL